MSASDSSSFKEALNFVADGKQDTPVVQYKDSPIAQEKETNIAGKLHLYFSFNCVLPETSCCSPY